MDVIGLEQGADVSGLDQGRPDDVEVSLALPSVEQGDVEAANDTSCTAKPVEPKEIVDTTVIVQQSGYATDVIAIKDVNGNVHCTTFHVRVVVKAMCACLVRQVDTRLC